MVKEPLDLHTPQVRGGGPILLRAVALDVARLLRADAVGIGRLDRHGGSRVELLALCVDGEIEPRTTYDLAGTPCAEVVHGESCLHPSGVREDYPGDRALAELGAEAYAGAPVYGSSGQPIGVMWAAFRRRLMADELPAVRAALGLAAVATAAEFERPPQEPAEAPAVDRPAVAERPGPLHAHERFRRHLLDHAPDALFTIASDGSFLDANETACRKLGYRRKELLAMRVSDIDPLFPPDVWQEHWKTMQPGGRLVFESRHHAKSGDSFPVEIVATRVPFQGRDLVFAFSRDVSERKQAEQALRESEQRFRTIFEHAGVGVALVETRTGRLLRVNARLAEMLGYSREVLLQLGVRRITHPDDVKENVDHLERLMAGEIRGFSLEKRYLHRDGRVLWGQLTVSPTWEPGEEPGHHIAVVQDITARVEAEAALRQAQKMEAVGRLAGGIAHDFNNLLTAINGYAELLLATTPASDPRRPDVEEVIKAGKRGAELTRQLLAFSRQQILRPAAIDPNEIVSEMERLLRRTLGERVTLRARLDPQVCLLRADRSQVEQILMNLALNARDAMPEGGELLLATRNARPGELESSASATKAGPVEHGVIEVRDTGTGMDRDTLDHIFDPFFTTKPLGSGTGLGLATVYGIVKQSGGEIAVDSSPERGTTFRVYLPAARAHERGRASADSVPERAQAWGAETVLWVEDEQGVRSLVARTLRKHGYQVLVASDPAQALQLARQHPGPIHALVTDVVMPGMSGPALARVLCRERAEEPIALLFVSGYSGRELASEPIPEHAGFLQKPFQSRELVACLQGLLERRESARR